MRKIIMFSALLLLGCKNTTNDNLGIEIYTIKGMDGKPEYIHFITEKEGYSFNTVEDWPEQTSEQLNDPNYLPQPSNSVIIYKTINGGRNWEKTDSIKNRKFVGEGIFFKNAFYVAINDFVEDKIYLVRKKINSNLIENQVESVYGFLEDSNTAYYTSKDGFFSINNNLKAKQILKSSFGNESLLIGNTIYTILRNNSGINFLKVYHNGGEKKISCEIEPECLAKINNDNIVIAGYNKKEVVLLNYEISTNKITTLNEFSGYGIVQGLKSNNKVICGFVGNIEGAFTEYNMFYSLDKGITWKIEKLKEESYIRPSFLIENNLYIYSGGDRMQKVKFK